MSTIRGGTLAATAAFRAHHELQSGQLVKASNTLSSVKVDGYALAKEAQELMKRTEVVEIHYIKKEEAIARKVGQLQDEQQRKREEKWKIEAELSRKRTELRTSRSSLQTAENNLSTAKREENEAKSNKRKAIGAAVGVGVVGTLFSVVTSGIGIPFAAAAVAGCAVAASSYADNQKRAEEDIRRNRQGIQEAQREIRRCNERISQIEHETPALTRQIEELEQEAGRYHEERGEMKRLIAFLKEAQAYWEDFAAATQHGARRAELVETVAKKVQKKSFFSFFRKQPGGKRQAMSLLEAWEEVQSIAKSGSGYIFQIDFECSRCGCTFRHLPYSHNMKLICNSCNTWLN